MVPWLVCELCGAQTTQATHAGCVQSAQGNPGLVTDSGQG